MVKKLQLTKDGVTKLIVCMIIASIFFLTMSILTDDHDSRKQIADTDGAGEEALCSILSEIEGVGQVNAMVRFNEESTVSGVIVTAQGAGDPVIKNSIIKGVAALYDIPASSVMVFEKSEEKIEEEVK